MTLTAEKELKMMRSVAKCKGRKMGRKFMIEVLTDDIQHPEAYGFTKEDIVILQEELNKLKQEDLKK